MRPILSIAFVPLLACSALIDPDGSRLGGGEDAGLDSSTSDAGVDTGTRDTGTDARMDTGDECPGGCDDGIGCTVDRCEDGRCINTPNEGLCDADERCAPMVGCVPRRCSRDEECNDGRPCNGDEVCDGSDPSTGCGPGEPLECDDGILCTVDACADAAGGCVYEARDGACDDGIDCTNDRCDLDSGCVNERDDSFCDDDVCRMGGVCDPSRGCIGSITRDCRDGDPCTVDGCDAATGCFNDPRDDDMDGFASDFEGRVCIGGTDCNDDDPDVNPDAAEVCNGFDDDCDEMIDEGMVCPDLPDTCATAEPIAVSDASRVGTARNTFGLLEHDYTTQCRDVMSRDAVYYVDVPRGTWDVVVDTLGSSVDTVLAVTETCGDWDYAGRGCNDDINFGTVTQSRVWVHRFGSATATRRLYILVEPYFADEMGDFVLNVRLRDATNDACSGMLNISEGGTVVGSAGLTGLGGQRGSCQPDGELLAGEGVFRFTSTAGSTAAFDAWAEGFVPTLYVRSRCGNASTEVACNRGSVSGGTVDLDVSSGTFVFVDGLGAGDSYTLTYDP